MPEGIGLAGLSDHRNYWCYGHNALIITHTSFLRNPNYRPKADTLNTLDIPRMAPVVNGMHGALLRL